MRSGSWAPGVRFRKGTPRRVSLPGLGERRARAAFGSGCGERGQGRELGSQLAAQILGSPAERLRSFLRRTTVGAEGSEDGAAGGSREGKSFLAPLGR